ncbi:MAG: cytochrome c peroxidase [Myxococcales bacterium]
MKLVWTRAPVLALASALACGTQSSKVNNDTTNTAMAKADTASTNLVANPVSNITCTPGFNKFLGPPPAGALPFTPVTSLKTIANPVLGVDPKRGTPVVRADLTSYVADTQAAIQLGKAFFWEMQAGSDGKTSCATCHFNGGQDTRSQNQLNPGANGSFDGSTQNATLVATNYPFVDKALGLDTDNITGSQGVRKSTYVGVSSTGVETDLSDSDPVFGNVRQVTTVNAPSTINAVYNHRNFFNGRAQNDFNGVNPWGNRDPSAHVWYADGAGNINPMAVTIPNAALASQAVAPIVNNVEMSAQGRTLPEVGRKLLAVKPLALQAVDAKDSVLGSLATAGKAAKGLKTTDAAMIQKAFVPSLWNSTGTVTVDGKSYSLTEANFSFFWGVAIMAYESTLVADNSPMDQYLASRTFDTATGNLVADNPALLDPVVTRLTAEGVVVPVPGGGSRAITRQDILLGLDLFEKPVPPPTVAGLPAGSGVGCALCHIGAETTSASITNIGGGVEVGDVGFKNAGFDLRMERMFMGVRTPAPQAPQPFPPVPLGTDGITYDTNTYNVSVTSMDGVPLATPQQVPVATYDNGWYDLGIRPIAEDPGVGGLDPFGNPLAWTEYYQKTFADPSFIKVPGGGLTCVDANGNPVTPPAAPATSVFVGEVLDPNTNQPIISGPLLKDESTANAGSFKTPQLRNVELNGPYFHSGGKATLRQVVEFYDHGGDFANETQNPLIRPLALTEDQKNALVAFLVSFTDDRVRLEKAPFDHPELVVPAGEDGGGADLTISIPAVGAGGSTTPVKRFLNPNPFQK